MSLKKVVGLLAGFALAVGLIGAGVGAQFTDQVKANENISVGTFACKIVDPSMGNVSLDGKSLVYTAPSPVNSAPGSAPFTFTVQNTGSIADVLTVSTSPVISAPWSIIGAPILPVPVPLAAGGSHLYSTGIQWTELDNSNLNTSGSVTWTVNCNEGGATTVAFSSLGNGAGQYLTDTISGTGFTPSAPITDIKYSFGNWTGSNTIDLGDSHWAVTLPTAGLTGSFTLSFSEDCTSNAGSGPYDDHGPLYETNQTVTVWATDGTHSATGTGIVVCGQPHE